MDELFVKTNKHIHLIDEQLKDDIKSTLLIIKIYVMVNDLIEFLFVLNFDEKFAISCL